MPGLEQAVAWLQEPYNQTAMALVQATAGVLALALIAGLAAAVGNARRRRRARTSAQPVPPEPAQAPTPAPETAPTGAPNAAYAAILRLTPNDPRARKGAAGLNS